MKLWQRFAVALGAVVGFLFLYIIIGVSILLGNGKPSGSD